MIDEGILEGDKIIIKRGDKENKGEIVVEMVDEEEEKLKRLRREGD